MKLAAEIGRVRCSFEKLDVIGFWDTWHWKLNSFLTTIPSNAQLTFQRRVTKEHSKLYSGTLPLLEQERSGFFTRSVYRQADGGTLWSMIRTKDGACYLLFSVKADWSTVTLLEDNTNSAGGAAFEYLAQMTPGMFLKQGLLTFHAALIEHKGTAIAISAASGTGKTTHARLWRDNRNAIILNGDRAAIRPEGNGWTAYGTPWSGTSGEQINRSASMGALVILERGEENRVQPLSAGQAFPLLLPHLLCPAWDRELVGSAMDMLDRFLRDVPVFRLCCRPDAEAVPVLEQALDGGGIWK